MTPKNRSSERQKRKRGNEMPENKSTASTSSETEDRVTKHRKGEIAVGEGYVGCQVDTMAQSRRDVISIGNNSEAGQGSSSQTQTSKQAKDEDDQSPAVDSKNDQLRGSPQYPLDALQKGSDQRSWKERYYELLACSIKERECCVEELQDLRNRLQREKESTEQQSELGRVFFCRQLDCGILPKELNRRYAGMCHEISSVCHRLADKVTKTTAELLSQDAEYWDIAISGREPRVKKLLEVDTNQARNYILMHMVLNYIVGQVFKPMLVGVDREAETLLQSLQKNLQSRMIPSAADKWIADLLHGYKLLPIYQADREHFLSHHSKKLWGFLKRLERAHSDELKNLAEEKAEKESYPAHVSQDKDWEDISQRLDEILEKADDLASAMSFSYVKFLVDWDHCEEKKEITKRELRTHELCLITGHQVRRKHFPNTDEDEKVADVVMFVRPPILGKQIGSQDIWGKPLILVEPVPGFDLNPLRNEKKTFEDFLDERAKGGRKG